MYFYQNHAFFKKLMDYEIVEIQLPKAISNIDYIDSNLVHSINSVRNFN